MLGHGAWEHGARSGIAQPWPQIQSPQGFPARPDVPIGQNAVPKVMRWFQNATRPLHHALGMLLGNAAPNFWLYKESEASVMLRLCSILRLCVPFPRSLLPSVRLSLGWTHPFDPARCLLGFFFFGHTSLFLLLLGPCRVVCHLAEAPRFLWILPPQWPGYQLKTASAPNSSRGLREDAEIIPPKSSVQHGVAFLVPAARLQLSLFGFSRCHQLEHRLNPKTHVRDV